MSVTEQKRLAETLRELSHLELLECLPDLVRSQRGRRHWSIGRLERELGIPRSVIWRLEHGSDPKLTTVKIFVAWLEREARRP